LYQLFGERLDTVECPVGHIPLHVTVYHLGQIKKREDTD